MGGSFGQTGSRQVLSFLLVMFDDLKVGASGRTRKAGAPRSLHVSGSLHPGVDPERDAPRLLGSLPAVSRMKNDVHVLTPERPSLPSDGQSAWNLLEETA